MSDEIEIRYKQPDDAPYIKSWFTRDILPWFPCQEDAEIDDTIKMMIHFAKWKCVLTAVHNGTPCGVVILYLHAYKKIAHQCLMGILVSEEMRNKGVGTKMIERAMQIGKEQFKLDFIYIEVFEGNPALSLYRRLGFRETGYYKHWLKEDDGNYRGKITMEKEL